MFRSIARRTVVSGIVAIVVLSGCGSDDDTATDSIAPSPASNPGTDAPATDPVPTDPVPVVTDAAATPDGTTLTIAEFVFSDVTVPAGTEFTITNADSFVHTVTDRAEGFDVPLDGGASGSLTIDAPGTYEIFCRIHTSMSGTITVT